MEITAAVFGATLGQHKNDIDSSRRLKLYIVNIIDKLALKEVLLPHSAHHHENKSTLLNG
jgi:hypothetical protein